MALHGTINVNGFALGYWEARRQDRLIDPASPDDEVHTYECRVVDHAGRREFLLEHRYGDGAVALAAAVLTSARP